jgi:hypothetical protein
MDGKSMMACVRSQKFLFSRLREKVREAQMRVLVPRGSFSQEHKATSFTAINRHQDMQKHQRKEHPHPACRPPSSASGRRETSIRRQQP